jgi:hypothetical protein
MNRGEPDQGGLILCLLIWLACAAICAVALLMYDPFC